MKNAVKVLIFVVAVLLIGAGSIWFYISYNQSEFTYADGAKNDTIEVNEYNGKEKAIVIPEKYQGKVVTTIAAATFANSDITSVEIPDTVTVIAEKAFYQCPELETVVMGENVKSIGESAFINCKKLKSIRLPASLETIDAAAFYGCENLTFEIDEGADFVFEDGILYNKAKTVVYWISESKNLADFTFPSTVNTFLPYAFAHHRELVSFEIPEGVTTLPDCMFLYCENLETVIIPDSVTTLEDNVFFGDMKLKAITLPRSVKNIGNYCFPVESSGSDFVLKVYENSSAHSYAMSKDVNFELIK